ncbi:MAG: TfoX/Sxy family protein [Pedobacter sp.]|nr:TfoX/Sxy family protein [Pedobacter sp.]
MAVSVEYAEYLRDLLRPLGAIRLRRMFGGYGIYADDLFFAVVLDEQLYIKVDAQTRPEFEDADLEEWVYEKDGKPVHMNYFRPPEDIHDDEDSLRHWGRLALDAALRAKKPVKKAVAKADAKPARAAAAGKASVKKAVTPRKTAHKTGKAE